MHSISTITGQDSVQHADTSTGVPIGAVTLAPDALRKRLAEAAAYAVLQRMAPVLRHDVAGLLQPVGILMTLLQKRIQMPEPDLQAIVKNLASVSTMAKEAATDCVNAIGWIASSEDPLVNLRTSVDEAAQLLGMDLSSVGLRVNNAISDDTMAVPQSFFRNALIGALLAFCDQHTAGGILQVTLEAAPKDTGRPKQLMLRILPNSPEKNRMSTDIIRKFRCIDWADVQAIVGVFNVTMAHGDGWLTLDLAGYGQ